MIKDGCTYKILTSHPCFSSTPRLILRQLEDDPLTEVDLEDKDYEEEQGDELTYSITSEFDGGCIMLYGVPESALVEFEQD
jgi:hypothetical protein